MILPSVDHCLVIHQLKMRQLMRIISMRRRRQYNEENEENNDEVYYSVKELLIDSMNFDATEPYYYNEMYHQRVYSRRDDEGVSYENYYFYDDYYEEDLPRAQLLLYKRYVKQLQNEMLLLKNQLKKKND